MTGEPGRDRTVKMLHVAEAAGVSRATVSLAFRNSPLIAADTKALVFRAAERLGYVYNRGAANLRTNTSNLVGLVVPDISNPVIAEAAIGLQETLQPKGYFVALANTQEKIDIQRGLLTALLEQRSAGLVLVPTVDTAEADVRTFVRSRVPLVLINRGISGVSVPVVGPDDQAIVELAVRHLADVHHARRIAYFGGMAHAGPHRDRLRAFRLLAGSVDEAWTVPTGPNAVEALHTATGILQHSEAAPAYVCHSDTIAFGLMRALRAAGHDLARIPVIGVDDITQAAMHNPPLTTVSVESTRLGHIAGQLISAAMEGDDLAGNLTLAPRVSLQVRESCGCGNPS